MPFERHRPARRAWLTRHEDRTVAVAHARAVRQQRVSIHEVRVRVERHGGDFVLPGERRAVERLDVGQHLLDVDALDLDGAGRQTIEHEGVVGIGTVGNGDLHGCADG